MSEGKKSQKKKNILKIIIIIIGIVIIAAIIALAVYMQSGKAAAIVNGEKILANDVEKQYSLIPEQYKTMITREMILEQLINEKLLTQEANKLGITATDEEVNETVNKAIQSTGKTEEEIRASFAEQGLTMQQMKDYYKKQLIIYVKLPDLLFKDEFNVTEQEINDYYDLNKEMFDETNATIIKATIKEFLETEQKTAMFQEHITELKNNATIEIFNENIATGKAVGSKCISKYGISKGQVIFYYADWCPHCENMKNLVEGFDMKWIEESSAEAIKECFSENYNQGFPQFICSSNGKSLVGEQSEESLEQFVNDCN